MALLAWPFGAQTTDDGVTVVAGKGTRVFAGHLLDSLSADTATASVHDRREVKYTGVALERLLALAGDTVTGLRGRQFGRHVIVEAVDGYRMVFGIAELDPTITGRSILLTRAPGEDGPWRLVVPGDRRGARWVRQVRILRVIETPR